ncbi:MAG: phosphatase PAP2 family protein [Gemmatimonadetes bacterium]|nr:phosphatase PAP2 family protein [Gemmatimonadota bacterium]
MRALLRLAPLLLLAALALPAGASAQAHPSSAVVWSAAGAAAIGGAFLLDAQIRDEVYLEQRGAPSPVAQVSEWLGRTEIALPVIGLTYEVARRRGDERVAQGAAHVAESVVLGSVADLALKSVLGRSRPGEGGDRDEFHPLSFRGVRQSFPSGHTTVAFAVASTVSREAHRPWVTALSYGTASMVGWSRVRRDRHWSSDVVAGAVLGIATPRVLERWRAYRADGGGARPTLALSPLGFTATIPLR